MTPASSQADDADVRVHVEGLSVFLLPGRSERFVAAMLGGGRRREKELTRLAHLPYVNPAFVTLGPRPEDLPTVIDERLEALGGAGRGRTVYVVSDDATIDGYLGRDRVVLHRAVFTDASALISIVPGRLALAVGELVDDVSVLVREAGANGR